MEDHLNTSALMENLASIRSWLGVAAQSAGLAPDQIQDIILVTDEAATNIILHGYQASGADLLIETEATSDRFLVRLRDHAPRFDPTSLPPLHVSRSLEERSFTERALGGFGVPMMRRFVHEMNYRYTPQGENELTLVWQYQH
jgi:serine/threonine-protein kinase RsbW